MPKRQHQEGTEELGAGDCAPPGAPGLCQRHCQHGMLLGRGGTACPCCPQMLGSFLGDTSCSRAVLGTVAPFPRAGVFVLPCTDEGQSCTYADDAVRGADAGTRGRDGGF